MKKQYVTPDINLVLFETKTEIMGFVGEGGNSGEDFLDGYGITFEKNGFQGTVVNNNGAPTFVPGGNGGGGRQTPLG